MKNGLFRKKALDQISSPEQLNDYIRVVNPSVWFMMIGVIIFLVGVCVWGIFGKLDTLLSVAAVNDNGRMVCYVKEGDISYVNRDMNVEIGENSYTIEGISSKPLQVDGSFSEYVKHVGNLSEGEWVYQVVLGGSEGEQGCVLKANIIIERISPKNFIFNLPTYNSNVELFLQLFLHKFTKNFYIFYILCIFYKLFSVYMHF